MTLGNLFQKILTKVIEVSNEMLNLGTSVNSLLNCVKLVRYLAKLFIKNIEIFKGILFTGKSTSNCRS